MIFKSVVQFTRFYETVFENMVKYLKPGARFLFVFYGEEEEGK